MSINPIKNLLLSFLHRNEIVLENKDHKCLLNIPLNKKISIKLKSKDHRTSSHWLPTKSSIKQFSNIKIEQLANKNISIIELSPGIPGRGKFQLYCLDKNNHQKVLDTFQISYNILEK